MGKGSKCSALKRLEELRRLYGLDKRLLSVIHNSKHPDKLHFEWMVKTGQPIPDEALIKAEKQGWKIPKPKLICPECKSQYIMCDDPAWKGIKNNWHCMACDHRWCLQSEN